jgi:VWFA-related protein
MTRLTLAALSTAAVVGLSAFDRDRQEPKFRAASDTVSIYATVLDETGRLVPDLQRSDFEVFDNGIPQPLSLFANAPQPVAVVLMIDRSASVESHFALVRDAATAFVNQLQPTDRARIGSFSGAVQIDPPAFTNDREVLRRILQDGLQQPGPTPLWNATLAAVGALAGESGRRVVLIFSDGKDSSSPLAGNATFGDVRARIERDDVMLYGVGLAVACGTETPVLVGRTADLPARLEVGPLQPQGGRGGTRGRGGRVLPPPIGPGRPGRPPGIPEPGRGIPGMPPPSPFPRPSDADKDTDEAPRCKPSSPDPGLRELAAIGGGGYFEMSRPVDLAATFSRVAKELHQQYLLAFPVPIADGALHTIEVRITRPGLTVRARRSYQAPK